MTPTDSNSARRIELILQQIEALPTLPSVAMRLLQITSADDSDAQQVIDLVKGDPALSAKILSLCKGANKGIRSDTVTIDRAVVMLGFESIRNAVLSIKVFETFADDADDETPEDAVTFHRPAFWQHCLAVAIASELIAEKHAGLPGLNPAEAFICGLLHDVGKLALEHALPKSYQRVVELTEQTHGNIAQIERKVLGIDHHTAGKRLAERWGLSHQMCDAIWLHGTAPRSLPDLDHRRMIGLVGIADLVVRRQHIGYSGNHQIAQNLAERAEALDLDPRRIEAATSELHESLERRAAALGLGDTPSRKLFLESIMQANTLLGRLNEQLETKRRQTARQNKAINAVTAFHRAASKQSSNVADVLGGVVASAANVLGDGRYGIIYQPSGQNDWQISQFTSDGRVTRSQLADPPPGVESLASLGQHDELPVGWMSVLPWLTDYLVGFDDLRSLRMLPLPCAWGTAAVLIHEKGELPAAEQIEALTHTWGAAIAAATQHEGARRLGEQLAEANRELTEAQESLLHHESLARLGEMAAGAAHEMNNPLAVISGRSQLLSMKLPRGSAEQQAAAVVFEQSQKLSDLITALHLFAESPRPKIVRVNLVDVMTRAIRLVREKNPDAPAIKFNTASRLPVVMTDPSHLAQVLCELIVNAQQSETERSIQITAQIDPLDDRLLVKVKDEGVGMDAHTLEHAFDPFFSAKQAGRQTGLGLARAQRLIEGLDGRIELTSTPGEGTTATVDIPLVGATEGDGADASVANETSGVGTT